MNTTYNLLPPVSTIWKSNFKLTFSTDSDPIRLSVFSVSLEKLWQLINGEIGLVSFAILLAGSSLIILCIAICDVLIECSVCNSIQLSSWFWIGTLIFNHRSKIGQGKRIRYGTVDTYLPAYIICCFFTLPIVFFSILPLLIQIVWDTFVVFVPDKCR